MEGQIVQNQILKRKTSQRVTGAMENSSSASEADTKYGYAMTTTSSSSPEKLLQGGEEEEEHYEVANCLILLARGEYQTEFISRGTQRIESLSQSKAWAEKKMNQRGNFECKACNRSFDSFQALGGHIASHKKLKVATEEPLPQKSASSIPPIPLENSRVAGKLRVHKCLICDAQFPTGQALGGHKRRHRVVNISVNTPPETPTVTTETKTLPSPCHVETDDIRSGTEFRCLDLNLPAASSSADEVGETKFSLTSKQNQLQDPGSIFTSPALVDCHY